MSTADVEALLAEVDPLHNTLVAYRIWKSDGGSWRQWVCKP